MAAAAVVVEAEEAVVVEAVASEGEEGTVPVAPTASALWATATAPAGDPAPCVLTFPPWCIAL